MYLECTQGEYLLQKEIARGLRGELSLWFFSGILGVLDEFAIHSNRIQ